MALIAGNKLYDKVELAKSSSIFIREGARYVISNVKLTV